MKKLMSIGLLLGLLVGIQNIELSAKSIEWSKRNIIYDVDESSESVKIVVEFAPNTDEIESYFVEDREIYDFYEYTSSILEELKHDCDSYASRNTPFIELIMSRPDKKNEYMPLINSILKLEDVSTIYIEGISQNRFQDLSLDDGGGGGSGNNALYSSIYENTTSYDGTGIKIGMMEDGIPDDDLYDLDSADITYYTSYDSLDITSHASYVAAIMVGDDGIAPDASLYSYKLTSDTFSDFDTAFTWMINSGVNVVNLSYGLTPSTGVYGSIDKLVDYYIYEYDIPIVVAAGNGTLEFQQYVASPGMAYNAVTVGLLDSDGEHVYASNSSYDEDASYSQKPTLVAQGEYTVYTPQGYDSASGTSFAAPAVTATIACMMDRRSILKTKPSLVTAILTAQTDKSDLESNYVFNLNGLNDQAGAGALDVNKSINSVWLSGYNYTDENDNYPSIVSYKSIYLSSNDEIRVTLWWEKRVIITGYNSFSVKDTLDLNLELRDQYNNLICISDSSNYNFEIIDCNITSSGVYYINVILNEAHTTSNNDTTQYFGYSYKIY